MAKFYIQSGQVSCVVTAQDVEGAAMWVMHRTIERMIEDDQWSDDDCTLGPILDGLAQFDEQIKCSQRGFGREDAGTLETEAVFRQWRQLMNAADYLFGKLN